MTMRNMTLDNAQVYDIEVFPNLMTLTAEHLWSDTVATWEISPWRDDRQQLMQWFTWLSQTQTPMIGFNSEMYDYVICHFILHNPQCTNADIYAKSKSIIGSNDRFGHTIWPRDRFAPQIDLLKVHHFDNQAKRTSLKALQVNMRSDSVRESRLGFDDPVQQHDIDGEVIPYNLHDVRETKKFAHHSMGALEFRLGLVEQFGVECLSWNDTKIGEKMLEARLGEDVCYERVQSGEWPDGRPRFRKTRRQTQRDRIALRDIIFPYVRFDNPEFQRVHQFMLEQVLTPDDLDGPESTKIKTKGVFTDLSASVGGLTFHFGTGGVHASVERQRYVATDEWIIRDIDVAALYPSIAIVNRLAPQHLGEAFVAEYAKIPAERKLHAKGTYLNASLKLAANGAWGKSNSIYSCFYDPQYAMTIPINGQLMICMLAEKLVEVPSLSLVQCNTDGISYMIHRDHLDQAKQIEQWWQDYTQLVLEDVQYQSMAIRDVNNYIAVDTKGKQKLKGAYWFPDPTDYVNSISNASPPAWHKSLDCPIVQRAAVMAMVDNIPPEVTIRCHTDPFDFMLRAKCDRSSRLMLGEQEMQRVMRYYIAKHGEPLVKISPPAAGGVVGQWKRANGVTKAEYERVMAETGGAWDERVCTKNKSVYEDRKIAFQAGWQVADCTVASDFQWGNLNYEWYIAESRKLII